MLADHSHTKDGISLAEPDSHTKSGRESGDTIDNIP